jgi:hypothetical protein
MVPIARSITSPQAWACDAAAQRVTARATDVFLLEAFIAVLLEHNAQAVDYVDGWSGALYTLT